MGTRADFYVGRGKDAEWLGSIAYDGHPESIDRDVRFASDEEDYRAAVKALIAGREDGTRPEDGWPWPWDNSQTTDYAYAFDAGDVWASGFGYGWFDACNPPEEYGDQKTAVFPDMSARKAVAYGKRSGLLIIG